MSTPGKFLLTSDALMIIVFITFLIWKVPPQWLVEYWSDPPSPANLVADVPPWPKLQIHSGNCLHMTEGAEAYWKSCTHEPEALKCYPPSTLRKYLTPGKTRWLDRAPKDYRYQCGWISCPTGSINNRGCKFGFAFSRSTGAWNPYPHKEN